MITQKKYLNAKCILEVWNSEELSGTDTNLESHPHVKNVRLKVTKPEKWAKESPLPYQHLKCGQRRLSAKETPGETRETDESVTQKCQGRSTQRGLGW